jgi:hypothetical protein
MALIKVRATAKGFNGGPSAKLKSVWEFRGNKDLMIADEDRGLKNIGDVFMIEESKFTASWMEYVDPPAPKPVAVATVTQANPAVVDAPRKAGRPKKVV